MHLCNLKHFSLQFSTTSLDKKVCASAQTLTTGNIFREKHSFSFARVRIIVLFYSIGKELSYRIKKGSA